MNTANNTRIITATELAQHNKKTDCWIALYGRVFDVTTFGPKHPGGDIIYEIGVALCCFFCACSLHFLLLLSATTATTKGGKDGTEKHYEIGHSMEAFELLHKFQIGILQNWTPPNDFEWPPYIEPLPNGRRPKL